MAPLPPEEAAPPRGRRVWLWILAFFLFLCLIGCVGVFGWLGYTDSGRDFQTSVADRATEAAIE
jgi:TRAP-type C4-dicarboxylate transport system permease small subunit